MNFYYDTILGLQYDYLGEYFLIDIAVIPESTSIKEFIDAYKLIYEKGISFTNGVQIIPNITDYKL